MGNFLIYDLNNKLSKKVRKFWNCKIVSNQSESNIASQTGISGIDM